MTVRAYLNFSATIRGLVKSKKDIRVREVMQICRIEGYADVLIHKLSKGYRQRVGVAQAIVHDPDVLILDEPTVGIDPRQVVETRQLIKELGQNHTIILSSHVLPEISIVCGKVIIMDQGRIVTVDKTENLSARLRGAQLIDLEVRGPHEEIRSRLKQIKGVFKVTAERAGDRRHYTVECSRGENTRYEIASMIVQSGWHLLELKSTQMSLEDIFLKLTTEEQT
jgi:ABC-2 type transport system ATP-binding protein